MIYGASGKLMEMAVVDGGDGDGGGGRLTSLGLMTLIRLTVGLMVVLLFFFFLLSFFFF